jgi:DNA-binding transcriptional MerR regulator
LIAMSMREQPLGQAEFSYGEIRAAAGLSKKEADAWAARGVIRSRMDANGHRRIYNLQSLTDALLAKRLADFSSRELLDPMLDAIRAFLDRHGADVTDDFSPLPARKKLLQVHANHSREILPGGGVRGIIPVVAWFNPEEGFRSYGAMLVVDLNSTYLRAIMLAQDILKDR